MLFTRSHGFLIEGVHDVSERFDMSETVLYNEVKVGKSKLYLEINVFKELSTFQRVGRQTNEPAWVE